MIELATDYELLHHRLSFAGTKSKIKEVAGRHSELDLDRDCVPG